MPADDARDNRHPLRLTRVAAARQYNTFDATLSRRAKFDSM